METMKWSHIKQQEKILINEKKKKDTESKYTQSCVHLVFNLHTGSTGRERQFTFQNCSVLAVTRYIINVISKEVCWALASFSSFVNF